MEKHLACVVVTNLHFVAQDLSLIAGLKSQGHIFLIPWEIHLKARDISLFYTVAKFIKQYNIQSAFKGLWV